MLKKLKKEKKYIYIPTCPSRIAITRAAAVTIFGHTVVATLIVAVSFTANFAVASKTATADAFSGRNTLVFLLIRGAVNIK